MGPRFLKEDRYSEAKLGSTCAECKIIQQQMCLQMHRFEVKYFHKKREHWGRDKLNYMSSIITLMAIVVAGAQVALKVTYMEESTSKRGGVRYKITYKFEKRITENIRETIPVLSMQHEMQQAINLDEENRPDIGYSDYKIRHFQYRLKIKFIKYSALYSMTLEEDRHEDVWEGELRIG